MKTLIWILLHWRQYRHRDRNDPFSLLALMYGDNRTQYEREEDARAFRAEGLLRQDRPGTE